MRIMIKGGVWKNTEDEILKAAVMKYGLNQWARISSLLVRKSAKQCKARWYEWLDPSIKKTEWSQEEDEKLLHLAKILPCQWRSIAPIVGRTAAQCLERYEHLLDSVSASTNMNDSDHDNESGMAMDNNNIRRLRPGEIDPNPETKPARPDAIDMDEDEKEMLSEARARLANTKGKKAKRKAREKQLEEARRLATLQKRRELKAAGIVIRKKNKKRRLKYVQYNDEIPFYRKTPRGFWDTQSDDLKAQNITNKARNSFKAMFIRDIEGERRDDIEERERKKDIERQKLLKKINLPELVMRLNANSNSAKYGNKNRKKLSLPTPQISENELSDIAKLTNSKNEKFGSNHLNVANVRTPSIRTKIMEQAQNALKLKNCATPLLGGNNVTLFDDEWNGVTPKHIVSKTPNINTPNVNVQSSVNVDVNGLSVQSNVSQSGNALQNKKKQNKRKRKRLRQEFESLPAPNYEYDVILPKLPKKPLHKRKHFKIEDAADCDARKVVENELKNEENAKKQSSVIQCKLPRPNGINAAMNDFDFDYLNDERSKAAAKMIENEMMNLINFDYENYGNENYQKWVIRKEEFSDCQLIEAKKALSKELKHQNEVYKYDENEQNDEMNDLECLYVARLNRFEIVNDDFDKIEASKQKFHILHKQISKQKNKMEAMKNKLNIRMGGYQKIAFDLNQRDVLLKNKLIEMENELAIYQELKEKEQRIIPQRIEKWKKMITNEKERQSVLQIEYEKLKNEHDELLN